MSAAARATPAPKAWPWTWTPHVFPKTLFRVMTPVEVCILWNIWDETAGGKLDGQSQRPEYAVIEQEQFAEWANCDIRAAAKGLERLTRSADNPQGPVIMKVIGRHRGYKVDVDAVLAMVPRDKRTLQRVDAPIELKRQQPVERAIAPGVTIPIDLEQAVSTINVRMEKGSTQSFTMHAEVLENCLNVSLHPQASQPRSANGGKEDAHNTCTRVHVSPPPAFSYEEFVAALGPIFDVAWAKPVDHKLARRAYELVGAATLHDVMRVVNRRISRRGSYSTPGLLPKLTEEAAELAAQRPPPPATPSPPPPAIDFDSANDGTSWGKIRDRLRGSISAEQFASWIHPTLFLRQSAGAIVVLCPDQVTVDFFRQEFAAELAEALCVCGVSDVVKFVVDAVESEVA